MRAESEATVQFSETWPGLPIGAWSDTCATLQLWMQIVGKVRMKLTPHLNHTWNVTLYPTIRGVTTMPMAQGSVALQIDFDFLDHVLRIECDRGVRSVPLEPMTVAAFYARLMSELASVGVAMQIWRMPQEVAKPIPFDEDTVHQAYDPAYAQRFWRILLQTTRVFTEFRARFRGKVSPVHLFWGAMDLACTRFSGRAAPQHPGVPGLADRVTRDAYSHEVSSCGFWPGGGNADAMFYSYAYPQPPGFEQSAIRPGFAAFDTKFGEFVMPYEAMRRAPDPDAALLDFLQSTYEAAADGGKWDRAGLEVG
ncbi:MAG: DUF5996 family protein [Terracidiphilus sp.]